MSTHEPSEPPIRSSLFRPMTNTQIAHHATEDIELLAKPLSLKLVSFVLASMTLITITFLMNAQYTSEHLTQGVIEQPNDNTALVIVIVPPDVAPLLSSGDQVTVNIAGYEPDVNNPIKAMIVTIDPVYDADQRPSGSQVTIKLNRDLPYVGSDRSLATSMTANVVFNLHTKSVMSWIAEHFRSARQS